MWLLSTFEIFTLLSFQFRAGHCSVVGFAIVPFFAAHQMFNLLSRWKQQAGDMFELAGYLPIEQEQENGDLHAKLHDVTRQIAENATNSDVARATSSIPIVYSTFGQSLNSSSQFSLL